MQQSILKVIYLKSVILYSYRFAPSRVRFSFNSGKHIRQTVFPSRFFFQSFIASRTHLVRFYGLILDAQNATMAEVARDFSLPILSATWCNGLYSVLIIYTFSIFCRLYITMNFFTDCLMGVFLGTSNWWVRIDWTGILSSLYQPLVILGFGATDSYGSIVLNLGKGLKAGEFRWMGSSQIPLLQTRTIVHV